MVGVVEDLVLPPSPAMRYDFDAEDGDGEGMAKAGTIDGGGVFTSSLGPPKVAYMSSSMVSLPGNGRTGIPFPGGGVSGGFNLSVEAVRRVLALLLVILLSLEILSFVFIGLFEVS